VQSRDNFTRVYATEMDVNDHSFILDGDTWHLFHIWLDPAGDNLIGHATSPDLLRWERQPDVLPKDPPPSWEAAKGGSAPYVFAWEGRYYLFYSRYLLISDTDPYPDQQQIGLAVSDDLFIWQKHPGNPVFHPAPAFSPWEDERANQFRPKACRDPHVMRVGDRFVLYYVAMMRRLGVAQVGHALSDDLLRWEDRGPVATSPVVSEGQRMNESPCVVQHNGRWHLFFMHGLGMRWGISDTPFDFPATALGYHAHASEVFNWGDEWFMSHCGAGYGGLGLARLDMGVRPPRLLPLQT